MQYRILKINLSDRSHEAEDISSEIIRKYIGGRGLGAYLLYREVPANADPLGENNHLIFTAGPASGTGLFYSSKVNLNTKSPLTDIYLYSIASGKMGHQMRKAGWLAIDITGIADSPIYLVIDDQTVTFKDGTSLWGMETAQVQQSMLTGFSGNAPATLAIGPAGEHQIPYAGVFTDGPLYRCFGRGGAGSVMGSKNLKGIVISGTSDVVDFNKEALDSANKEISRLLKTDSKQWAQLWRRYETGSDLETLDAMGILPTRNWQTGRFEGWHKIDKTTTPMGWPVKGRACGPYCPTPGCRDVEVKNGPYKGACSDIEWETIYAFGSACGIDNMAAVIAASQICDEYGIDTISAGLTISFAMECFEKGLITTNDTDGVELRFGNDRAMVNMLRKIVDQKGLGRELSKGARALSLKFPNSATFAMHAKGMELGGYECRGLNGQALQFAVDPRGGCHHGFGLPAREEISDDTRLDISGKGEYVKRTAVSRIVRDSMIVCTFAPVYNEFMIKKVLTALFHESWSTDAIRDVGLRVMGIERLFNMREGYSRKDDTLPGRLLKEPLPDGPDKGMVVPLEKLKDDFYAAMEYDIATGNPDDDMIAKLGIDM